LVVEHYNHINMSDTYGPLISSGVAGPLGVLHLPRLWQKVSLEEAGKLASGYPGVGTGFDAMTLGGTRTRRTGDARLHPYAKPNEQNVGVERPKIRHVAHSVEPRKRRQRQAERQAVIAQRRAIKKAARRHLKEQLIRELKENE
jgi:hypothetical protein